MLATRPSKHGFTTVDVWTRTLLLHAGGQKACAYRACMPARRNMQKCQHGHVQHSTLAHSTAMPLCPASSRTRPCTAYRTCSGCRGALSPQALQPPAAFPDPDRLCRRPKSPQRPLHERFPERSTSFVRLDRCAVPPRPSLLLLLQPYPFLPLSTALVSKTRSPPLRRSPAQPQAPGQRAREGVWTSRYDVRSSHALGEWRAFLRRAWLS